MNNEDKIFEALHTSLFTKVCINDPYEDKIVIAEFCKSVLGLMRSDEFLKRREQHPVLLMLHNEEGKSLFVAPENLSDYWDKGGFHRSNLVNVNYQGEIIEHQIETSKRFENSEDVSDFSWSHPDNTFFFLDQINLTVFIKGRVIKEITDVFDSKRTRSFEKRIHVNELSKLLELFRVHFIRKVRPSVYWASKRDWELKPSPENFFSNSLYSYLENYMTGGWADEETFNYHTDDRTDVRIIRYDTRDLIVIEVKWIGKTKGSDYEGREGQIRANDGIEQLKIYLNSGDSIHQCCLVVFDARKEKEEILWNRNPPWDARIFDPPLEVQLENESASKKASKQSRKLFRENENKRKKAK